MSRTATYHTSVVWKGEHWGHLTMGNGPQMMFSALMFIWAAERFKLDLQSYECPAEGTKLIELDRTEIFTELVLRPKIVVRADGEDVERIRKRVRRALESAQKYSLVANSVKSKVVIDPIIEVLP
jgi:hypothetical protein